MKRIFECPASIFQNGIAEYVIFKIVIKCYTKPVIFNRLESSIFFISKSASCNKTINNTMSNGKKKRNKKLQTIALPIQILSCKKRKTEVKL